MKRAFYLFCFVLFGLELQLLLRVGAEALAARLAPLWQAWPQVDLALTVLLFLAGAWWGYANGVKYWNIIYVEKRFGWPPKWDRKFRKREGSRT